MTLTRTVAAEVLDGLAAHAPAALRSRRDLRRLHRAMATRSIVSRGLRALIGARLAQRQAPLRVLELGAGDGSLLLGVARTLAWPKVELTLLDRQALVSQPTLAAYASVGWSAVTEVTDVLDWAAGRPALWPTGSVTQRWDLIVTTLFLHHFDGPQLDALLAAIAARGDRFFACEPHRAWLALAGSHLVGAIGANAVTRADAVLSVRAGFRGHELTALWPAQGVAWQLQEYAAGLFSHCLRAARAEAV